jgi:hypothetical protein
VPNIIGRADHAAPAPKESLMARFRKAIVAVVGLAATLVSSGALDGKAEAIVSGLLAIATAAGVYQVKNQPSAAERIQL